VFAEGKVTAPRSGKKVGILIVKASKVFDRVTYVFKRIVRVTERPIFHRHFN